MSQPDPHTAQEAVDVPPLTLNSRFPPSPFTCRWEAGCADGAWIEVAGELDLATSPQLRQALQDAQSQARLVALDLRALTFVETSTIHVILDASAAARRREGRLVLIRPPANVERALSLITVHDQVPIIDLQPGEPASRALLNLA